MTFRLENGKIYYGNLLIMELDDYMITVKKTTNIESVEMEIDVGDKLYEDLVVAGMRGATKDDYFKLGFTSAIMKGLVNEEAEECEATGQMYLDI